MYAFTEQYCMPISHDEVVHGKCSLIGKMPGDYEEKFSGVRSFMGYMMAHPGKKLTFMGTEFAQFIEWKYDSGLDWLLLDYEKHRQLKEYVKKLNHIYLRYPALWEIDYSWEGFNWIVSDDKDNSVIAFVRNDENGDKVIAVCNFTPVLRENYKIGVPDADSYEIVFNTDSKKFGGNGEKLKKTYAVKAGPMHGYENYIEMKLPPMSTIYLKPKKTDKK
jgi:1,4-alpha-glucan branching enzyme